jgi:hypothetical protein
MPMSRGFFPSVMIALLCLSYARPYDREIRIHRVLQKP